MDNPVQEIIEERLLKLLGLEFEFEMSYEEYIRHLKEALVAASMVKSKFSSEESELIRNEWKRVKNKKGRFYIKIKKTIAKSKNKGAIKFLNPAKGSKSQRTGFEKDQLSQVGLTESLLGIVISIRKSVSELVEHLKSENALSQKSFEQTRKDKENKRRREKEEGLEGGLKKVGSFVSKILTPVQGILDKIFRFITFTLLGQGLKSLFEWLKDPENKRKFKSLVRFFTDHWKVFVGLFILFGTSFGAFVRGMLKAVTRGLIALAFNIPRIKRFLRRNPNLARLGLGAATLGTGLIANTLNPPEARKAGDELKDAGKEDFDQSRSVADQASKTKIPTLRMGGMMPNISLNVGGSNLSNQRMSLADGVVGDKGIPFSGGGKDNRLFPTASGGLVGLSGKEFIVNEGGVTKETLPVLMAFNRMGAGGSANKPKMINSNNIKIGGLNSGGPINFGGFFGGGLLSGVSNFAQSIFKPRSASGTQSPIRTPLQPPPEYKLPQVQALLRTIRTAEHYKDSNPYNSIYGGGTAPVTKMTVKEVIDMGNTGRLPTRFGGKSAGYGSGSSATGAYQFMPFTLQDLVNNGKVKLNQMMSPDLQDRLGWELVKRRGVSLNDLKGGLSKSILNKLAPEWASLPTMSGQSFYGQPVKPAATLEQVYRDSLKRITAPPGPPVRKISSITLPPTVIDSAKNMAMSSISNEGDTDMVADLYGNDSFNKTKLLNLA